MIEPRSHRLLLSAVLLCLGSACTNDPLLGEELVEDGSVGTASAPRSVVATTSSLTARTFELEPERHVPITWRYDLGCSGPCKQPVELLFGRDGDVWVVLLGSPGLGRTHATLVFARVGADGLEQERYARENAGGYSYSHPVLDASGRPSLVRRLVDPGAGERVELLAVVDGTLTVQSLPETLLGEQNQFVALGPDGRVYSHAGSADATYVASHATTGERVWEQRDLREAPPNVGSSTAVAGPRWLSDGAQLVPMLKAVPQDESTLFPGFSVLDAGGDLRWDLALGVPGASSYELAAAREGGVVLGFGDYAAGDASVVAYAADGRESARWTGRRTGYYPGAPLGVATDADGRVYGAFAAGSRAQPALLVCDLGLPALATRAVCAAVDGFTQPAPIESSYRQWMPSLALRALEPGVLVLTVYEPVDDVLSPVLVRVDLR